MSTEYLIDKCNLMLGMVLETGPKYCSVQAPPVSVMLD